MNADTGYCLNVIREESTRQHHGGDSSACINKRIEDEIGEPIIAKQNGKWRLIKKLRSDFAVATRGKEMKEQMLSQNLK